MSLLRFFMFFSLIVWVGSLVFFAFVLAPTVFLILPTHTAGSVISISLTKLHWMGVVAGLVFLICSMTVGWKTSKQIRFFEARHVLLYFMLVITSISQFVVIPKMNALRKSVGDFDSVAITNPARVQFDALHAWSVRLESGVLLLGLAAAYLTARRMS